MCVFNIVVPLPGTVWFQPDYSILIYSIRPLACVSCELCATFIDVALPLRAAYSQGKVVLIYCTSYASELVMVMVMPTPRATRESGPASYRSA